MAPELRGFAVDEAIPEAQARTDLIHMYGEEDEGEVVDDLVSGDIKWSLLRDVADIED